MAYRLQYRKCMETIAYRYLNIQKYTYYPGHFIIRAYTFRGQKFVLRVIRLFSHHSNLSNWSKNCYDYLQLSQYKIRII